MRRSARAPRPTAALCLAVLALVLPAALRGQDGAPDADGPPRPTPAELAGYWTGAFVAAGSVQAVSVDMTLVDGALQAVTALPEWPWVEEAPAPVTVGARGKVAFRLTYGLAELWLDAERQALVGEVRDADPPLRLQLSRTLRPPRLPLVEEELRLTTDVTLAGSLVRPAGEGPWPAVVLYNGRGCKGRGVMLARARVLARYGMACLSYDKRGTGDSEGDCNAATIDDLTADALAMYEWLREHPAVDGRVGVLGYSAGAWLVARVWTGASVPPAFCVSMVGPATSVYEQQLTNVLAYCAELGLSPEDSAKAARYVELLYTPGDVAAQWTEMEPLIAHARETGWDGWFEETDVPTRAEDIPTLWARLKSCDPTEDLATITAPFLALYGGADEVVVADIHVPRLRELLGRAGNDQLEVHVLPGARHALWLPGLQRRLPRPGLPDLRYRAAPRIAAGALQHIVDFLERHLDLAGA